MDAFAEAIEDEEPGAPMKARDLADPFAGALGQVISRMAADASRDAPYRIHTTDHDVVAPPIVGAAYRDSWLAGLDERTGRLVSPMQKGLERALAAKVRRTRLPGQRSGRLNGAALHRVATGDDRLFRRVVDSPRLDTAVSLLIDNSGSMRGEALTLAMATGYALAQTLERCGVPCEVLGFTTGGTDAHGGVDANTRAAMAAGKAAGLRYSRCLPLRIPVYKAFAERLGPETRRRIAWMAGSQEGAHHNVDGESVEIAARRLMVRPERRRILMVLSDGMPACNPGVMAELSAHLKRVVADLGRSGVETLGIGILTDVPARYYPRSVVIRTIEELPAVVLGEIRRLLAP